MDNGLQEERSWNDMDDQKIGEGAGLDSSIVSWEMQSVN